MRIFTRYILREVTAHAVIGASVFTFVLFLRDVTRILELVVRHSAPLPSVAEIFFYALPAALTYTVPMGVLVGILIGLSRLAADSEVTAMRASGLGAWMFVRVIALFALAAWLLALANTLLLAPRSAAALGALQDRLKSAQVSFEIQPRVFYESFHNKVLYVQDVSTAPGGVVWKNIFLADISNPSSPILTVAERGVVVNESPTLLRLHLENGSQHEVNPRLPGQYSISTFSSSDIPIPLPAPEAESRRELVPVSEMPLGQLLAHSHDPDPARARWYRIEFHRRLAMPFACLVLALVGIPLGLSAHKGGKSTGFVLTIVLVFLYYFVSLVGISLGRQGKIDPALGVWGANLLFFLTGAALLVRVNRRPLEMGSLRGLFGGMKKSLGERLRGAEATGRGSAFLRAYQRRRMFSANFPLILDDYILRDFILYLLLIVATFVMLALVFTFFELLGDIVRNRVPLVTVGAYLLNVTPYILYTMTPLAVLLAVLITFGLMQKANEITALKATGISIYRMIVPVLVIAAVIAVGLFALDQFYLPQANTRQEALRNQIKGKPAQTFLRPDRKWIMGEHDTIYYYEFFDPDRDQFASVSAFRFDPKSFQLLGRMYALRAHWAPDLQNWVFENGWERNFRGPAIESYQPFGATTFADLNEPPAYFKKEVRQSSEMNYDELSRYISDLQQSGFDVVRLRVQLQKKFAYPLITLVMAVLAVPFALGARQRGVFGGVAVAIGIAVVYLVTSGLFEALGNVSQLPAALAAWAPDLLFALVGGYYILKVPT